MERFRGRRATGHLRRHAQRTVRVRLSLAALLARALAGGDESSGRTSAGRGTPGTLRPGEGDPLPNAPSYCVPLGSRELSCVLPFCESTSLPRSSWATSSASRRSTYPPVTWCARPRGLLPLSLTNAFDPPGSSNAARPRRRTVRQRSSSPARAHVLDHLRQRQLLRRMPDPEVEDVLPLGR
jgi:hypothetical protein